MKDVVDAQGGREAKAIPYVWYGFNLGFIDSSPLCVKGIFSQLRGYRHPFLEHQSDFTRA